MTLFKSYNQNNKHWPISDIVIGIILLLSYRIFTVFSIYKYKPWLSFPISKLAWFSFFILMLIFSLFIIKKRNLFSLYKNNGFRKDFSWGIIYAILIIPLFVILTKLLSSVFNGKLDGSVNIWQNMTSASNSIFIIISLIIAFTIAPISEEVFFRGFLYNALKTRFPKLLAAGIQIIIFTLIHSFSLLNSFRILLLGILLTYIYEKRNSLFVPIFAHIIINFIKFFPILLIALANFYIPAQNWEEAQNSPAWYRSIPDKSVEKQVNATKQREYAISRWGSRSTRQWKRELNGFNAVSYWFPNEIEECAKARYGIVHIYYRYLRDFRRAIIEANKLIIKYPSQVKEHAGTLSIIGWSYYMLKDFSNSRASFNRVINEYGDFKEAYESAKKGIKWLDAIGE